MSTRGSEQLRPSKTAEYAAGVRALHTLRVSPPIFEDTFAIWMCGTFWRTVISSKILTRLIIYGVLRGITPLMPAVYTRAVYGEERIEIAVREGIRQYVLIGAGYDTFAARRPDMLEQLAVFELDLPGTQQTKFARFRKAGISVPDQVRYVATDLNRETVFDALARTDFDASAPALFSWFGVTYYLGRDAIEQTLQSIAATMAPGSSVVFDYLSDPDWTPAEARDLQSTCARFVGKRGEPWISTFDPREMPKTLAGFGYEVVHHLEPDQVGEHYFKQHPDLNYPPFLGLCQAALPKSG